MSKILPQQHLQATTHIQTHASTPKQQRLGGGGGSGGGAGGGGGGPISFHPKSSVKMTGGFHATRTATSSPQTPSSRQHSNLLNRLPMSRLSSPGSRVSSPVLPSNATPLGLMFSSNRRLSQSITRKSTSPPPSHSPTRNSASQTNILRIDTPNDQNEFTIFETKNYSQLGSPKPSRNPPSHPSSSHGAHRRRSQSPSEPSPNLRPYSRQSEKETFFKTLEGAQYKKVKILKPAALHHVQSIYKMIKKREMRSMRYQATVSWSR
jgi:hypothetical protein